VRNAQRNAEFPHHLAFRSFVVQNKTGSQTQAQVSKGKNQRDNAPRSAAEIAQQLSMMQQQLDAHHEFIVSQVVADGDNNNDNVDAGCGIERRPQEHRESVAAARESLFDGSAAATRAGSAGTDFRWRFFLPQVKLEKPKKNVQKNEK